MTLSTELYFCYFHPLSHPLSRGSLSTAEMPGFEWCNICGNQVYLLSSKTLALIRSLKVILCLCFKNKRWSQGAVSLGYGVSADLKVSKWIHNLAVFVKKFRTKNVDFHPKIVSSTDICCNLDSTSPDCGHRPLSVSNVYDVSSKTAHISWPFFKDWLCPLPQQTLDLIYRLTV